MIIGILSIAWREKRRLFNRVNPLRAKLVENLSELDRYRWCGHGVLMDRIKHDWQDRDYVLSWFDDKEGQAEKGYRQYCPEGRP